MVSHEHELNPEDDFSTAPQTEAGVPVAIDTADEQLQADDESPSYDDPSYDHSAVAGDADLDVLAAKQAWDADSDLSDDETTDHVAVAEFDADDADQGEAAFVDEAVTLEAESTSAAAANDEIADAFVGRWNCLVSNTNWEKGRIISQWRRTLIESGAAATDYSDEAWSKQVGGVTASHVGRLRRVYDAFGDSHESYRALFWTHFLVALDWDDAPLWLEGASQSRWSVSQMRQQHCEANGGDAAALSGQEVAASELDEDFTSETYVDQPAMGGVADIAGGQSPNTGTQPAQGGGSTKQYDKDGPGGVSAAPEGPDFGDEESLNRLSDDFHQSAAPTQLQEEAAAAGPSLVQPFAGLPELPDDLVDAVEMLKLSVLRHKTSGWKEVPAEVVLQYLQAFRVLVEARGQ